MTVIEVRDLIKSYSGRRVVDEVSFDVSEGEIFGILGPNGAGKTTTVECIEGLRRPDGGNVKVLGLDPQRDGVRLRLILVESKLLGRDRGLVTFGLVLPAVLLWLLGAFMPGFTDVDPDPDLELGGLRLIDLYTPIVLVLTLAMTGVSSVSSYLAAYRHEGVLRRMQTTPVGPGRLLTAQLVAHLLVALAASAAAVAVARLLFDVPMRGSWPGLLLAVLLAATSLFSIGLLIGAVVPSPSAAPVTGGVVWIGLMVLAGLCSHERACRGRSVPSATCRRAAPRWTRSNRRGSVWDRRPPASRSGLYPRRWWAWSWQ